MGKKVSYVTRRRLLKLMAAITAVTGALGMPPVAWGAGAEDYPSGPITFVVPNPPGLTDALTRAVGQAITKRLGHPITVVNRPGAASQVGAQSVALAEPDGYTVLAGSSVPLAELPILSSNVPYKFPEDFSFISLISANNPWMISVSTNLDAKTLGEVVEYAKANPGKVRYGSVGVGSGGQLAMSLLAEATGAEFTHIPYAGGVAVATAVLSGEVDIGLTGVGTMLQHADSDRVRLLAVTSQERSSFFPDVPSTAEAGFPSMVADIWWGIVGPAGIPKPIAEKLAFAIKEALADEEVNRLLGNWGLKPAPVGTDDFEKFALNYLDKIRAFAETPAGKQMMKDMAQ